MIFSGQVLDTAGNPLPFASVYPKYNMITGQTANEFGQFSVNVNLGDPVVISYVGYKPQEIKATTAPATVVLLNNQVIEEIGITANTKKTKIPWVPIVIGSAIVGALVAVFASNKDDKPKTVKAKL
ncbi:carboxypeptidase-like regulatory domain-containing protein [Flavobacterium suncheonense]|uniref:TonB-dependent receptor plug domain-containing protein n=1 Tax=Flavobacterium suncheonense GH29-5 = DSM 17707 TaxID=1121899 RepID=A0A0A2MMM9_9FLAO|nr:carboxypeptidase-like regulatory domain-containing protein [Flavobacterium suncheonense]KGO89545.1 hypothetical protein Q764_07180 [Flavobacterium suncheonense GH29-5 = DSM 17707]